MLHDRTPVRLLCAAAWLLAPACTPGHAERQYELRGQVLGVDQERQELLIKHDDIEGFMPGMTMPFKVQDAGLMADREPGDLIRATLVVEGDRAYLAAVEKTGSAPVDSPSPAPTAASGFELLRPGTAVPDLQFVDQAGRERTFESLRGRAVALTFIYTRCPIPTFCPFMDRQFAAIQRGVKADSGLNGRVHLLSVSFDPAHDTPDVLRQHADKLGADPELWSFATGDRDAIDRFAMRFGVTLVREGTGEDIAHNLRTAIVDPEGRVVRVFTGVDWTPEEILAELARAAGAHTS